MNRSLEMGTEDWITEKGSACSNLPLKFSLKEQYDEMVFKSCACLPNAGFSQVCC